MDAVKIQSFSKIVPMIYAYNTPGISYHEGWTKVGYTERQTVEERIRQQTHTAGIKFELAWQDNAMYKDGSGEYFTDRDFHSYLESKIGIERKHGTEWFHEKGETLQKHFNNFASRTLLNDFAEKYTYTLREEQQAAVTKTMEYFKSGGEEFLWNAKPRFGKTLTAYDLIQQMGLSKVLIVTNRPSIANSWLDDFVKFVSWKGEYAFVSDTDALNKKPGVMTRDEFVSYNSRNPNKPLKMIAFESLQGLKGSVYFGGNFDKLQWMAREYRDGHGKMQKGLEFDLLIVDESQEGVDTNKTDRAFANIERKHTLYLSGTPFKQLASEQFSEDQIFNWSYADEQEAKAEWKSEESNPYERLPRLSMFTYQLSDMIQERVKKGIDLSDGENVDYAFDLNEFFSTDDKGKFTYEDDVRKFLHSLTTQEKYPFSTPDLRQELSHTMWYLNRIASAKALKKLLEEDPVFKDYEIVLAAGDGRGDDEAQVIKAFDRVKAAIAEHDKTITLTVGQLTVGVTIPEWSGVLMLCNMKSPSSYMQAAFRAQNPCTITREGKRFQKETAYVFDFDPARTLIIFDEFANNLSTNTVGGGGTSEERKKNIARLLNFFPVIGEDTEGRMVELDAASVLSIPRKLKSQEVVRRGFMSNFLFQNISNIFAAPAGVKKIVEKLNPAQEEKGRVGNQKPVDVGSVKVNGNGEVEVPEKVVIGKAKEIFGKKIYESKEIKSQIKKLPKAKPEAVDATMSRIADAVKDNLKKNVVAPVANEYGIKSGGQHKIERKIDQTVDKEVGQLTGDYYQRVNIAKAEYSKQLETAETEEEINQINSDFKAVMDNELSNLVNKTQETFDKIVKEVPKSVIEQAELNKREKEKKEVEDDVRDHLRGFSRTIPSFIMAYGDGDLRLDNFDQKTDPNVFKEVTGITFDEFRFLRDGGDFTNPETKKKEHFEGHLFNEVVFNDSIEEFWKKKQQLANYFDESSTEDIFDYIPPQKTNQIFTPRWVVNMMVDQLEENNPGCFNDPNKTFADLYMKSGLYITEIVKRLYKSDGLKKAFPDDKDRIRHILSKQVYGMAPTEIIYLIAKNYILGFDNDLKLSSDNFVLADAAEASKKGTLAKLVNSKFDKKKQNKRKA